MSNKNKQKGTAFETLVTNYINSHGAVSAFRQPAHGAVDKGDIHIIDGSRFAAGASEGVRPDMVVQCKNWARLDLAGWLEAANDQKLAAGADSGVVVFKRRGKGDAARQYVLMDLETLVALISR